MGASTTMGTNTEEDGGGGGGSEALRTDSAGETTELEEAQTQTHRQPSRVRVAENQIAVVAVAVGVYETLPSPACSAACRCNYSSPAHGRCGGC